MGCTKGQFSSCGDIFKISFCLKNPTKRSKKNSGCYLIEKNAKPSSPDLPRRRRLAEEEERYPTTKVHANADETLSARIRARQRFNRTHLDIFIVFPPFLRLYTRLRATHFISDSPDTGQKRKPRESNPIRERAQKK